MKNKNLLLNFLKGVGCIGVVLIHVTFPGVAGQLIKRAMSWAVPLFFLISGYYAYDLNDIVNVNKIKQRLMRKSQFGLWQFILSLNYHIE